MSETFAQALKRLRGSRSIRDLALLAACGKTVIGDLETGRRQPTMTIAAALDSALGAGGYLRDLAGNPPGTPATVRAAQFQAGFAEQLAAGPMTPTSLEEWEVTIARHGRATRYRPEAEILDDLLADFTDLRALLGYRHPPAIRRRLLSACASLSGLLALTLLKLDDPGARDWWRTGRAAAAQAEDRPVLAWIYAQESYQLYYGGDFAGALDLAIRAQQLAGGLPCVADALTAPLEARVHARAGRRDETADALRRAEVALARLDPVDQQASAFGYDAAQLAFHSGSAWTLLHDTTRAWDQQQRAIELYPEENRLDRALVALDRAECLTWDGHISDGAHLAAGTVAALPTEFRSPIVLYRARDVAATVPETDRRLPEVRVLQELLALPSAG
ncbi:helix-turn-helix transcriptional regulator [Kitasatospora sp. NPDC001175]|uniref:helix-turn-helix transcriptional regulator n=1 Tax=Kitasatospora sp. NPDC001175 TaxID=3157103 RepID=UPI003D0591EB